MSTKRTLTVGGLEVNVYSLLSDKAPAAKRSDVVAFFLLHGRYGSAEAIDPIARSVIEQSGAKENLKRELLIITFDHRNHGKRLVNPKANDAWSKDPEKNNEQHAVDMYAIQTGTARDVSFLIDFLPSFLYPDNNLSPIVEWGVAGISLGGHATWIALSQDSRIKTGIPIIGCPDYLRLIRGRGEKLGLVVEGAPYLPGSFKDAVKRLDPPYTIDSSKGTNPFLGKRVLVMSGAKDTLVPWDASEWFIQEKLDVGPSGVKKVSLYEGVGHECTEGMVKEMADFIREFCL